MFWPLCAVSVDTWILFICAILLARYNLHRAWRVLDDWNIPHDPPSILNFGHARNVLTIRALTYELECKKKYGSVWGYYRLKTPWIAIHDLEILRQILLKEFPNFSSRFGNNVNSEIEGKEIGSGVFMTKDAQWKRERLTLTPAFSTGKLRKVAKIVDCCVSNTLVALKKKALTANGVFVVKDTFSRLSLDVICSTAFSTDVNSQTDGKEPEFSRQIGKFMSIGFFNLRNMLLVAFPFLIPLLAGRGGRQAELKYLKNICETMLEQRKTSTGEEDRVDLLQLMIKSKISESEVNDGTRKGMTKLEITGNAISMLLAGYETTGSSMIFLAYNLAMHPEVQKNLQTEIDKMYDKNENLDFDAVNKLKYLDMCINESLRLYTPIPRTVRTCKNKLSINGLTIPRGWSVTIPLYALCHDPEHWDSPMVFNPERMRDMSKIDPMVFQPFGSGPRNCIGSRFAFMEIKLAFCKILRHFTLEPICGTPKPPLKLRYGVVLRPKVNFSLRVVPRSDQTV